MGGGVKMPGGGNGGEALSRVAAGARTRVADTAAWA